MLSLIPPIDSTENITIPCGGIHMDPLTLICHFVLSMWYAVKASYNMVDFLQNTITVASGFSSESYVICIENCNLLAVGWKFWGYTKPWASIGYLTYEGEIWDQGCF